METRDTRQHTLTEPVSFVGVGLHSGKKARMTLRPCDDASGIFFRRMDRPVSQALIAGRWHRVTDTNLSTGLSNSHGVSISTVEHLMAALRLCGIDNLEVEVDGPEIPIMDGSAKPFVETLCTLGTRPIDAPRRVILVHEPVTVRDGERCATIRPHSCARVSVSIDFPQAAIGSQSLSVDVDDPALMETIAPARTFGFMSEIEGLRQNGLALGGSLNNAILVDRDGVVNPGGLRFADEFVRHKVLDTIGDLSLIGMPVIGEYRAFKSGHLLNKLLIHKLLSTRSAWSLLSLDELPAGRVHRDDALARADLASAAHGDTMNPAARSATGGH